MQTSNILNDTLQADYKAISATFLKEWTPAQFTQIQRAIAKYFKGKTIECKTGRPGSNFYTFKTYEGVNEVFGLAYTSSGDYAGYWVCNVAALSPKYTGYKYEGFAIGADNKCYAILWDKDENEIIIPL